MNIEGFDEVGGRKAYVLTFKPQHEELNTYTPELKHWQIPEQVKFKVDSALEIIEKEQPTIVKYWIDTELFVILKTEEWRNGPKGKYLHWQEFYKDIKLNHLSKKDF